MYSSENRRRLNKNRKSRRGLTLLMFITAIAIVVLSRENTDEIPPKSEAPSPTTEVAKLGDRSLNGPQTGEIDINSSTSKKRPLETQSQIPLVIPKGEQLTFQQWQSKKGAAVYFKENPEIPMLDVDIIFKAGSAYESKELNGVAQLTNRLLTEGTKNFNATELAAQIEGLGAIIHASSSRDSARVSLRCLTDPEYLLPAIDLFAEIVGLPSFTEESFERISQLMELSLEAHKQQPNRVAIKALLKGIYDNHPYEHSTYGSTESLKNIERSDVKDFYEKHYVTKNAVISMVGAISEEDAKSIGEKISTHLRQGSAQAALPTVKIPDSFKHQHIDYPSQQTYILFGLPSIRKGDPIIPHLYLANEILGGGGFSSILQIEIRENRGLSYSVGSSFSSKLAEGPFIISLQTKSDTAKEAITIAREQLNHFIKYGPTPEQLEAARNSIIASRPLQLSNNASIVNYLGTVGFYNLPANHIELFHNKILSATAEETMDAFRSIVQPDKLLLVTLGPNNPLSEKAEKIEELSNN